MSHKQECQAAEGGWGRAAPLCQPGPDVSQGPACLAGFTSQHSVMHSYSLCSHHTELLELPKHPPWAPLQALVQAFPLP